MAVAVVESPTIRDWWYGFTDKNGNRQLGIDQWSRIISAKIDEIPWELPMSPREVIEFMAEDRGFLFPDGSPKRKGSHFTADEGAVIHFYMNTFYVFLCQDAQDG